MNFFNNNISQTAIISFLDWFAKISIEKYSTVSVSGSDYFVRRKIIPVPCQWGAKEKFVEIVRSSSARRLMNPDQLNQVELQWILPRISVNLTGASYDSSRRLIKTQKVDDVRNNNSTNSSMYSPTPYNLDLEVSTISRNVDENFQIMEQIIPYFSPAMSMNLKLNPGSESESVKIILNSMTIDNPVDIPENDERLFTNTYSFTLQLNYFISKKTINTINNISTTMQVIKLEKSYVESLNTVQDKFTRYINNSSDPNPLSPTPIVPTGITSTYSPTEYAEGQESDLFDIVLTALGDTPVIVNQSVSGLTLTTSLSGTDTQYNSMLQIYYSLDDEVIFNKYESELLLTFTKITYWVTISTKTDVKQLQRFEYTVI